MTAENVYKEQLMKLGDFCENFTDYFPEVETLRYPCTFHFGKKPQIAISDETVESFTVTVATDTTICAPETLVIDSSILSKIVKLCEKTGNARFRMICEALEAGDQSD